MDGSAASPDAVTEDSDEGGLDGQADFFVVAEAGLLGCNAQKGGKTPLFPIPEDRELHACTPKQVASCNKSVPAGQQDCFVIMSIHGGTAVQPPPPLAYAGAGPAAWRETWEFWTRDAIVVDGWSKLCWRQIGYNFDPATGALVGGPLELVWMDYGSVERRPAEGVSEGVADAARRRFRGLYSGAVPPIHHHQQPMYKPLYKIHVPLGTDYRGASMWLY